MRQGVGDGVEEWNPPLEQPTDSGRTDNWRDQPGWHEQKPVEVRRGMIFQHTGSPKPLFLIVTRVEDPKVFYTVQSVKSASGGTEHDRTLESFKELIVKGTYRLV